MKILFDLKKFAFRGNLVDMAVGFTVGAAFTALVKSLVDDLLTPPIGLLLGQADFTDLFVVLREGVKAPMPYETLAVTLRAGLEELDSSE